MGINRYEMFQFVDNRVFIDIGRGCGNACKYCYLEDSSVLQTVFDNATISECIQKILKSPKFRPGKFGTIVSFCPHTEPFKSKDSAEMLLFAIKELASYENLMQFATKELIPDFFIKGVDKVSYDGQITAFISISSLDKQEYYEPFAKNISERLENINNLHKSKIRGCVYLKPFLFDEMEFERLSELIREVSPDAICIGVIYSYLEKQDNEIFSHPTEKNLFTKGKNEKMLKFYDCFLKSTHTPVYFTSTCVVAKLNNIYNNAIIPKDLCIGCSKECVQKKWGR